MNASTTWTRKLGLAAGLLLVLAGLTGCDLAGMGGMYGSCYGYPAYGLYDPTSTIQSVIDYRQDVMDWSANAWDEYILE